MYTKKVFQQASEFSKEVKQTLIIMDKERSKCRDAKVYYNKMLARFLEQRKESTEIILNLETLSRVVYNCEQDNDNLKWFPFIEIEPILEFAEELSKESAQAEAKRMENVYMFLLGIRRLKNAVWGSNHTNKVNVIIPFYEDIK